MAEITVREFATVLKVPVERLLAQLADAGLVGKQAEAIINEQEKSQLLAHLRRLHGKDSAAPEVTKITLSRKTVSEIKIPADKTKTRSRLVKPGVAAKTVAVEFRRSGPTSSGVQSRMRLGSPSNPQPKPPTNLSKI